MEKIKSSLLALIFWRISEILFYGIFFIILSKYWINSNAGYKIPILLILYSAVVTFFLVNVTLPSIKKDLEWRYKWHSDIKGGKELTKSVSHLVFFSLLVSILLPFLYYNGFLIPSNKHEFYGVFLGCIILISGFAHFVARITF